MEIRKRINKSGTVYVVRWREAGKRRAKSFRTKKLAERFGAELQRRSEAGDSIDRGEITLAEFLKEWWAGHGMHLAKTTQHIYAGMWDRHIGPALGDYSLNELSARPEIIQRFHADLIASDCRTPTVRKTLFLLQGVLQRENEWNRIRYNPVASVRKPRGERNRAIIPSSPWDVEALIVTLHEVGKPRDAALIATLAYAGLRPGEALALEWRHIRKRTILVEAAVADGVRKCTKTGAMRTVELLGPLADDLEGWRCATDTTSDGDLIFPNHAGTHWTRDDWKNFRNRTFLPAVKRAGIGLKRPCDLRHSFCSLLIFEGRSVVEVAQQMGHDPTMTLSTYAHVFAEYDPADRRTALAQIAGARAARRGLKMDANRLQTIESMD